MAGEQEKCALIVPRRNFLIRALGFTAMGASVPVPVLALDTPQSRLEHHIDCIARELGAMHPGYIVTVTKDTLMHGFKKAAQAGRPYYGDIGIPLMFSIEHQERSDKKRDYERARQELAARFGM